MTKPQTKEGYYFCEEEYKFKRKSTLETAVSELNKRRESVKRTTRENVRNVLMGSLQGNVGIMVAGIVAGLQFCG